MMIVEVVPADCGGSGVLWGTHMYDSNQYMCLAGGRANYRSKVRLSHHRLDPVAVLLPHAGAR